MRHILFFVLSLLALSTSAQVRKTTTRGTFSNQPPPAGFTLGSFENTPGYLDGGQVARRITDSLTANAVQVTSDLKVVGNKLSLATPNGTTAVTDNAPTLNSTNPVSSGGVYNALNQRAPAAHTQTANTITDFGPAILAWMQAQPGAGTGTVWSFDGRWVSATSGTALPQLAASTLTASASSSVAVGLSWTSSPNALTYVVEQAIDAQFSNGLLVAYSGNATSATLNGLASGTQFFYRIKAKAGGYADSDYAFATATTSGTSIPTLATPTVTPGSATSSTVAFSWNAVSNAQSYSVTFATNNALTANATSFTTTSTSYSPTGLTPSTTYYLGVVARATGYTNSGQGTASLATSAPAAAGATQLGATTITISSLTTTSATASWGSVANATNYQFQRATDNGFTTNVSSATYSATSVSWGDLTAATTYYVRVKALGNGSSFTDGNYSPVVNFTTTSAGGGSTTALAGTGTLYQNGATTTTTAVSWSMVPGVTNGSGNSYVADISTSSSFATIVSSVNSATTAFASFTGLTANTTYYVRVKAVGTGSYTDGPYSNAYSVTTSVANGSYAVERTFKVNLSTSSNTSSGGTGWNTLSPALASITSGYVSPNFTAADGASSTVSLSISSGFNGGGVNYFNGVANVPNAVWPAQVMQRGWTYPQAGGTIRVNGLTAGKVYQVYGLSSNISTAQASYATMTAGGVTGGIKYIPGGGTDGSPGETSGPALLVINNIGAPNGYIDLVVSRPAGTSNQPFQGFIIQESSVNK